MDSGDDTEKKGTQSSLDEKTELHEQRIRKKKLVYSF